MRVPGRLVSSARAAGSMLARFFVCQPASPWPPVFVFAPLVLASVVWNLLDGSTPLWAWVGLPALGYLLWTLLEYVLHLGVFHRPRVPARLQSLADGHLDHHDDPTNPGLIVARLSFSVPVAIVFFGLFSLALQSARLAALLTSGMIVGYLSYEVVHFAIHRSAWVRRYLKPLASHHLHHHYADPSRCFGVSVPLWDWVFRTGRRRAALSAEQPVTQSP